MRTNAVTFRALPNHCQTILQSQQNQHNSRIETEGTGRGEGSQQPWESQGKDRGPEQVRRDGEGHADLSVRKGEDLGGVGKRNRPLAWRIESSKQEDEESD